LEKKPMKKLFTVAFGWLLLVGCNVNKATTQTTTSPGGAAVSKSLEGTYWMLTELNGKPVSEPQEGEKPSFIYFDAGKKRVSISGGCNVMGGSYELLDGNRIEFGQLISTMMACPDMTNEEGLKQMTSIADNFAIQENTLSFAKARMAPVARFKAVKAPEGFKLD
jgi:heat shock protein HslJ